MSSAVWLAMSATEDSTVEPLASDAISVPLIAVVQVKPTPLPAVHAVRFAIYLRSLTQRRRFVGLRQQVHSFLVRTNACDLSRSSRETTGEYGTSRGAP